MKELLGRIGDLFYPPRCFVCREVLTYGEKVVCTVCSREERLKAGVFEAKAEFVRSASAPFLYRDAGANAVRDLKFKGQKWLAEPAAGFMHEALTGKGTEFDLVTWIPMHKGDVRRRGFDQSKLLARRLAKRLDLPCVATLEKVRRTARQSTLSETQRRANVIGIYKAVCPEKIRGKRILLTDDVITTGSTVSEAARTLLTAGAGEVSAVSLAVAGRN